jgi:DNA-directed RNA polymerase specialized sigma24 family protein
MKKTLIFDIDGTLWDSRQLVAEGYNIQFQKEGREDLMINAEILKPLFGKIMKDIADALLASVPAPQVPDYTPLYQAVDGLPEKLRVTVILYYFEEMDVNTTAQVLGIPPGTVKSRLNKARTKLKEVLGNEPDL